MARILIVEDDESIRNLIELTLMQFQYETVSFEDAETAWEYLKKNSVVVSPEDRKIRVKVVEKEEVE
mgnify:CR=1 FL=1